MPHARWRDGIDLLLPPRAARLPPSELLRLRLGVGACIIIIAVALLMLPFLYAQTGMSWYVQILLVSVGAMIASALTARWARSGRLPGLLVSVYLLGAAGVSAEVDPNPVGGFWYVLLPVVTNLLVGPPMTAAAMTVAIAHMLWFIHRLSPGHSVNEFWDRADVIVEVLVVGGVALLYEHLRQRAEQERDRAQASAIRLAQEQALREEAAQAQARLVRQQALRVDVGAALAEPGPPGPSLQHCAEALVRHLDASLALVWTAEPPSGPLELQACAGRHALALRAALEVPPRPLAAVAQDGRPFRTSDARAALAAEPWTAHEGVAALAAYPLRLGGQPLGVVAVLTPTPLPEDTEAALAAIADALAQGLERRRAEQTLQWRAEELARSNAELERFAYVASHDLQEPLRMVSSYTQLLARRYRGKLDESADEFIGFVIEGTARMQRLILDLLTYARVGTRGKPFAPVSVQQVLNTVLQDLRARIEESGATVTADALPVVCADEVQLGQLLQNLVSNALKFRTPGVAPRVHISAEAREGLWLFQVRDNGIGIDPSFFNRLFVLFQRLHTRADYPGTGIGLAICKKIVERHGGRIWVESSPSKGATFSFTLPSTPPPGAV